MFREIFKRGELIELKASGYICKFVAYKVEDIEKCFIVSVDTDIDESTKGVLIPTSAIRKAKKSTIAKLIAAKIRK